MSDKNEEFEKFDKFIDSEQVKTHKIIEFLPI